MKILALTFLLVMLAVPTLVTAQTEFSLASFLNIPPELLAPDKVFLYVIVPLLLMIVVVYAVLEEIRLFIKPGINIAIAILGTLMLLVTQAFGQFVLLLYGTGFTTILILMLITLLAKFIKNIGIKLEIYGRTLSFLVAFVYGAMVYWMGQLFFPDNQYVMWAAVAFFLLILLREEWARIPKRRVHRRL